MDYDPLVNHEINLLSHDQLGRKRKKKKREREKKGREREGGREVMISVISWHVFFQLQCVSVCLCVCVHMFWVNM